MREVHVLCRPFLMLASQRTGVDSSAYMLPLEGGEPGTGTAICAQCGLSEEIVSRLGGGELDTSNNKWYCKPCWDAFSSSSTVAVPAETSAEADLEQQQQGHDDEDIEEEVAVAMSTDIDENQNSDGVLAMHSADAAEATSD